MRILHLSDLHIPRMSGVDGDGIDARATLAQLLHDCRRLQDIDLVAVSGDIADDGSEQGDARPRVPGCPGRPRAPHWPAWRCQEMQIIDG